MPDDQKQTAMEFALADVLGTITGVLLGDIRGIYKVSEFMAGEPVWTHQLPRVGREIAPVVLRQHPQLAPVIGEAEAVTKDNYKAMLADWVTRFGATIPLTPMGPADHARIDPVSELAEIVHPDQIIVVQP
jgi:hypothetical protein